MCTVSVTSRLEQNTKLSTLPELPEHDAHEKLLCHLSDCLDCLFAMARQRGPLLVTGCPKFQELFAEAYPLFDYFESPLANLHLSEDMIDSYCFGRLSSLENKALEFHVTSCRSCDIKLQNGRMFIYAMKAALSSDPSLYRNRNGATFHAISGA